MFRGINAVNLDPKGRIAIPTRCRARLVDEANSRLVVTIDTEDNCLLLYPFPEWELIEQKLEALPSFNKAARRIQRLLIGHATELEMDGSGRVLLPSLLRDYASIEKSAVLVGQVNKFEIWSEANWHLKRDVWLADGLNGSELPPELQDISL